MVRLNAYSPKGSQELLFDTLAECNLNKFNLSRNTNNTILYYILCNSDLCVSACNDPLVPEDLYHKPLEYSINFNRDNPHGTKPRHKHFYHKADYIAISSSLLKGIAFNQ